MLPFGNVVLGCAKVVQLLNMVMGYKGVLEGYGVEGGVGERSVVECEIERLEWLTACSPPSKMGKTAFFEPN